MSLELTSKSKVMAKQVCICPQIMQKFPFSQKHIFSTCYKSKDEGLVSI